MSSQQEHSLILDSLPQSVLVVSQEGEIRYSNASAEALFNTSHTSMRKTQLRNLLPSDVGIYDMLEQIFSSHAPVNAYEIDISTPKTGVEVVVDIYGAPFGTKPDEALLVLRQRGMAQRIANQLSHRTAARSVTGLASMLAHEIKNPLSGIRGAAQLLNGAVSGEDRELTDLITSETDRVVGILERMEVFSDESPIEASPVNVHSVMGQVRKVAETSFGSHVRFIERYDPSLPPVSGSHDELVQVFMNLVKNASEALRKVSSPRIELASAYRPGIRVSVPGTNKRAKLPLEFTVSDNGPGIPEEIRSDIFEPFVTTRINGTGLGLALVAKTIGRHGGVIECSDTGAGTTFRLLLPSWSEVPSAGVGG